MPLALMNNWKKYKLIEIIDLIGGGTPKTNVKEYWNGDIPWLSVVDFNNGQRRVYDTEKRITELGFQSSSTNMLKKGQLIISARGTVGVLSQLGRDMTFNQSCYGLDAKRELTTNDFLYYLVGHNINQIKSNAYGSVFDAITKSTFENIDITLPPLSEQYAIAEILSSLDNKIELNLQINKTLEEMANALYKHWFVDFGPFKGDKFVKSELGLIPEGWEIVSLEDVTSKITDGAHLSPKSQESGYPMASVKDMFDWGINTETCRLISEEDYLVLTQQGCKPLKNDILIAKDGSFLKHSFVVEKDLEIVLLSSIAMLRPNGKINSHLLNLYLKLGLTKERLKSIVSGAVIQRIVLKDFRKFKIILPPIHIQKKVILKTEPLINQCWSNNEENNNLKQVRDYLLPKLISGEIRVKDAAKRVKELI